MQQTRLLPLLLPLLVLAACTEDQPPTAPAEPGGPAFSHTPGHKVVNSLADPGTGACDATECTLREAINDPASSVISFARNLIGTITLDGASGQLFINKTLSIIGPGQGGIIIQRQSTDPNEFRIFDIGASGTVMLANLTITGGTLSLDHGGGIRNVGRLRLITSTVTGNSTTNGFDAGGIWNGDGALLKLTNSTVSGNSADNVGGGIWNISSRLELTNSRVTGNTASLSCGGLVNDAGTVRLTNSTVSGNSAPDGGGICNAGAPLFELRNSTVSGNSATNGSGGGIFNIFATLELTNSSVSGNTAAANGGGLYNDGGVLTLTHGTVAGNSAPDGGGIHNTANGPLTLTSTLVALNTAPTGPDVSNSGEIAARFNLLGDGGGSGVSDGVDGNQVGSASAPIDPKLGPLANNGGPTQTHALRRRSPAIDAASAPDCPRTDQRGVRRPQGPGCDIGSYERRTGGE